MNLAQFYSYLNFFYRHGGLFRIWYKMSKIYLKTQSLLSCQSQYKRGLAKYELNTNFKDYEILKWIFEQLILIY